MLINKTHVKHLLTRETSLSAYDTANICTQTNKKHRLSVPVWNFGRGLRIRFEQGFIFFSNTYQSAKGKSMSGQMRCIVIERQLFTHGCYCQVNFSNACCWWNAELICKFWCWIYNCFCSFVVVYIEGRKKMQQLWLYAYFCCLKSKRNRFLPIPRVNEDPCLVTKYAERHSWLVSIITPAT